MSLGFRQLFIWVEGPDDLRFFDQVVKPIFDEAYDWVEVRPYAHQSSDYVINFIKSIEAMGADYIFTTDINLSPCVTDKKQRLRRTFKNIEDNRTIIVVQEIESWYLAGLDGADSETLGLPLFDVTDEVKKENFDQLIPGKFDSRIDFMLEILKQFSTDTAVQKNHSFKYFAEKFF